MPNWCSNTLTVTGDKKELNKFKLRAEHVTEEDQERLSFAKFVPEPDYTKVKVKPTYPSIKYTTSEFVDPESAWWDWRIQNWGTKWEVSDSVLSEGANILIYSFDTAWSPPIEWLYATALQFPRLTFKLVYREDGNCVMGVLKLKNDEVLKEEELDTSDVWDRVGEATGLDGDELTDLVWNELDELEESL